MVTQGEGIVKRTPDQAWLSIITETREGKAEDARQKSAESMVKVQTQLRNTGLSVDSIQTKGYRLEPEMEWKNGRGTVKGYIVRNQIDIRIDNLDRLSDVIDSTTVTGSTTLRISGLRFVLKNQQVAEADALRLAVQNALAHAQAIASGAQQTLGHIIRIEELNLGGVRPEIFPLRTAMVKSNDNVETPITVEDVEVRAQVTLTVELR